MHMCVSLVKSLCLFDYYIYIYLHTSGIYNYICHMYVYNYIYIHAVLLITVISHCGSIVLHTFTCFVVWAPSAPDGTRHSFSPLIVTRVTLQTPRVSGNLCRLARCSTGGDLAARYAAGCGCVACGPAQDTIYEGRGLPLTRKPQSRKAQKPFWLKAQKPFWFNDKKSQNNKWGSWAFSPRLDIARAISNQYPKETEQGKEEKEEEEEKQQSKIDGKRIAVCKDAGALWPSLQLPFCLH